MKASDIIKKKGKTDDNGSKKMNHQGKSSALIDWIGKRRHGAKKMVGAAKKGRERDEGDHEY